MMMQTRDQPPQPSLIPAAQYLRMSTDQQQYSLENQALAIAKYAERNGFEVTRTYCDAARSGLVLRRRAGLRQLLGEVVSGRSNCRAILVYDVSRWGRFQDADESAHYEFLCKSAGVPVHYCADIFGNDGGLSNAILKALKRTMAGEYSRELGVKVVAGQLRLARLGFRQGGSPGYGLRRLLVSGAGQPKQELGPGEQKSIATDRVILVPGPSHEVEVVREIYQMHAYGRFSVRDIVEQLNRRGCTYMHGAKWDLDAVHSILSCRKYCGYNVYNRTSERLSSKKISQPQSEWVVVPGAFQALVDPATFDASQKVFDRQTRRTSNQQLLQQLGRLLKRSGRLTGDIIDKSRDVASCSTYISRFGSLREAYKLVGYGLSALSGPKQGPCRTREMQHILLEKVVAIFPGRASIFRQCGGGGYRPMVTLDGHLLSVRVLSSFRPRGTGRALWRMNNGSVQDKVTTLLARLDENNQRILDLHLVANTDLKKVVYLKKNDRWLKHGIRLRNLKQLTAHNLAASEQDAQAASSPAP